MKQKFDLKICRLVESSIHFQNKQKSPILTVRNVIDEMSDAFLIFFFFFKSDGKQGSVKFPFMI